ncbi:MAG: UPF0182 family protein [Candidatus Dormibacteria bacterium]
MTAFGFDPEELLKFRRRPRPRVIRPGGPRSRRRWILWGILASIALLLVLARSLVGLRVGFLFFDSLGHTNVFWTPLVAQVLLFLIGSGITGALVAASIPGWVAAARNLDVHGGPLALWAGAAVAVVAGVAGGVYLAGQWQDVLLWVHGHPFGAVDPAFQQDFSFYLFTLPVLDALQALAWTGALLGLVGAVTIAVGSLVLEQAAGEIPITLTPPPGRGTEDALRVAVRHAGICLVAVFGLAALGAHFGAYHLTTSVHDNFVGLDATQRTVIRPVLGALQFIALGLAIAVAILLVARWRASVVTTAIALGSILAGWLVLAGALQTIPAAVYQATSVNPNAQSAQTPAINDFLVTSRAAWGIEEGRDVEKRQFDRVASATLPDLAAEPGTLRNVRIQDYRQLPDTFAQIDRSRSYQTYPTITVDRYPSPDAGETEVMVGPREIAEEDLPSSSFVSRHLLYTHGYGITAASVNRVAAEGKPDLLAGKQPLQQVAADAPPDLSFGGSAKGDPRIFCGLKTTQAVAVNTTQNEFDYPAGTNTDQNSHGSGTHGIAVGNSLDRLALSLDSFGGFDFFLTNALTAESRVLIHREINDRITTLAPFLKMDGDPYIVADRESNHLVWVADAYVESDRFPESFRFDDGTSYMRNAVKAVVDARTCGTTLYAVDAREPLTAAYNDIYPGLLKPLSAMPANLKSHLRYPEDLLQNQSRVYASVHVPDAATFFNSSDRYRVAQELIDKRQQDTQAYYVELTLPNESKPKFVLLQTFSPATSGGGGQATNLTALLAAQCDYTTTNHPKLVSVPLGNALNVLGPLQFDNNINTNQEISKEITLLGQSGSTVILGNVIVLPFNNRSFLYVRPLYVAATGRGGSSFPQLQRVIVGTQDAVAHGSSLAEALQALLKTDQAIPGLGGAPVQPSPPPGTSAPAPPAGGQPAAGQTLSAEASQVITDLLAHQMAFVAASQRGDFTAAGREQDLVKGDTDKLSRLLRSSLTPTGPQASPSATPPAPTAGSP